MKKILSVAVATIITASSLAADVTKELKLASEVNWTFLNPKRGNLAPSAGDLWGDRTTKSAAGYLLKPSEDFSSPPHIHNVSYRAIVINGLLHNDDPDAANMWLPAGSYWTQPKGEVHITSAKGKGGLVYVEIEEGPYLVLPKEMAFDSGERPINIDASNIMWLDASTSKWIDKENSGVKIAYLWGDTSKKGALNGTFIKLPAGFKGKIKSNGSTFKAVVIKGTPEYKVDSKYKTLETGSYFGAKGGATSFEVASKPKQETVLYVRTNAKYDIIPSK